MKMVFATIFLGLFFIPCFAQERENLDINVSTQQYSQRKQIPRGKGGLTLVVFNLCGEKVGNVKIRIEGENFKRKLKTNQNGYADIVLPQGVYKISVNKIGYVSYVASKIEMPANSEKIVQFNMKEGYSSSNPKEGIPLKCPPRDNIENVVIYEFAKN